MMKKIIYPILFFILVSCASAPPDIPVCMSLKDSPLCEAVGRKDCGYCVHIMSGNDYFVGDETEEMDSWERLQSTAIIFPHDSYKQLIVWIINTCKRHKCSKDVSKFLILD
jgi:hypothetical protein